MLIFKTVLAAFTLLLLAIVGMAIQIIVRKNGQFPSSHVGHNKEMKKKGLVCANTWDRLEQKKARGTVNFKKLKVDFTRFQK